MHTLRTCLTVMLATAAFSTGTPAFAHWPAARVDVEIYDRTEGRILPIYFHGGRRYVVGKPGNEYAIRVRNASAERALAVMSVDGVNIISGDTASPAQSGYVLAPSESADIAGWRTGMTRTAAFYFTTLADSYAARTARPDNVGVIGVAVFRERARVMPQGFLRKDRDSADSAARREGDAQSAPSEAMPSAPVVKKQLGTGYGRSEDSHAQYTTFDRASDTPAETIAIYYDSYQNLLAQGVPVASSPLARVRPDPFPDRNRFVPEPR
jgi:hypothetical protein